MPQYFYPCMMHSYGYGTGMYVIDDFGNSVALDTIDRFCAWSYFYTGVSA